MFKSNMFINFNFNIFGQFIESLSSSSSLSTATLAICSLWLTLALVYLVRIQTGRWLWTNVALESRPPGFTSIPLVAGRVPLVGHAHRFLLNPTEFMRDCVRKYGPIFQIQLFKKRLVMICDHELAAGHFKEKEPQFSFEQTLRNSNLDWMLYDNPAELSKGLRFSKKCVSVKRDYMVPRIDAEARRLVERISGLGLGPGRERDDAFGGRLTLTHSVLQEEMLRFTARSTSSCFFSSGDLSERFIADMLKFFEFVIQIIAASYVLPSSLVRMVCSWKVRRMRTALTTSFENHLKMYQDREIVAAAATTETGDDDAEESILIRKGIQLETSEAAAGENGNGAGAAGGEGVRLSKYILAFMFASLGNTSTALLNTIIFLAEAQNASVLAQLRSECERRMSQDPDELLKLPLLEACVLEMARMSPHLYASPRVPVGRDRDRNESRFIGKYFIGKDVDDVALAGCMLMSSEKYFKEPHRFWPNRFLGQSPQPSTPPYVLNWGSGVHICPGQGFAVRQIKIALAHFVLNFDFRLVQDQTPTLDYTSPLSFAKLCAELVLTKRCIDS